MVTRTKLRHCIFQVLFANEFNEALEEGDLRQMLKELAGKEDWEPRDEEFVQKLIRAYQENRDQIDRIISRFIEHWELERLVSTDRCLLRMAVAELLFTDLQTPASVVINETIEMGKRFGTEDSGKFINGVLDRIVKSQSNGQEVRCS